MDEVDALFKEYDTLRQESLDSMQNRTQIVAFGLGTLAVLAAPYSLLMQATDHST